MRWRYRYRNAAYVAAGSPHGERCSPVHDARGRCVVAAKMGQALVVFEDGVACVVVRRGLRLIKKRPRKGRKG